MPPELSVTRHATPPPLPEPEREAAPAPPAITAPPVSRLSRVIRAAGSGIDWVFGLVALIAGLALSAVVPVLNLATLGYMVHASSRVAASGRLREGLPGIRQASVVGSLLVGTWLVFLPIRILDGLGRDAGILLPGSPTARAWHWGLLVLALVGTLQVLSAASRGGRLRHFLRPAPLHPLRWLLTTGRTRSLGAVTAGYVTRLRLPYLVGLGTRALLGGLLWLAPGVGFLFLAMRLPSDKGGLLVALLGGFLLMLAVAHLPFLQVRLALENRFRVFLEPRAVRDLFGRAPVAFLVSLLATVVFAIPLYLLKVELPPREIAWLPSLLFVLFILPARLLTGWAMGRAVRHPAPRHWAFRWTSRLGLLPVLFLYALIVHLVQYISWDGTASLLEQHAFLVPAPLHPL